MLKFLCIALVMAGPWLGPVWPEAHTAPAGEAHAWFMSVAHGAIHIASTPGSQDQRTADDGSLTAAGEVVEPPVLLPDQDHSRRKIPHPTRILLVSSQCSSFL